MAESLYCAVCAACFCIPSEELLLSYLDESSPYKPITEDDVHWLGRFYIILNYGDQSANLTPPERHHDSQSENANHIVDSWFLSGPGRIRHSKVEFQRGNIPLLPVGVKCHRLKGEAEKEVIGMSFPALSKALHDPMRHEEILLVHIGCYDGILRRAVEHIKPGSRNGEKTGSINMNDVHTALLKTHYKTEKNLCAFNAEPPRALFEAGSSFFRKDWIHRRRVGSYHGSRACPELMAYCHVGFLMQSGF